MLNSKILIVDDSLSIRKIIEKILKSMGFKDFISTDDGLPALKLIKDSMAPNSKQFDLIISDWHMDKMSGLDLLKTIRSDAALKNIPFLMVTSSTEQPEIILAIEAGVSDYIVKPFNANLIQEKVFKALKKAQNLKTVAS